MGGYVSGRNILVTGAGRGIGQYCAVLAAVEGASVVVNDVDEDAAGATVARIRAGGGRAVSACGDVSNWAVAEELVDRCIREFGAIDGLVNNAGRFYLGKAEAADPASVRDLLDTNVVGAIACGTYALVAMLRQGFGAVVNVVSGAHLGIPYMSVYGASKGAVASLTYGWALEVADRGVRVNAVSPLADTRMLARTIEWFREEGLAGPRVDPAPDASASAIVYLLSRASREINGQIVRVEGDQLSVVAHPAVRHPVVRGEWSVAAIDEAFHGPLSNAAVPLGVSPIVRAEFAEGGSSAWEVG